MRRRDLLIASALATAASRAEAQMDMPAGGHGMRGAAGMPGMAGMAMPAAPPAGTGPALPTGAALARLPVLATRRPRPGLVEAELEAGPVDLGFVPGLATPGLGYAGRSPGPVIELIEGERLRLAFRNRIPGQETTIHWHGMPVPADQDGNPMDPVASGAGRVYDFTLPEGSAATYWYHPHPHGLTAEQVYRGLAGAVLVRPAVDPVPAAYADTLLFLTDLRLAADGSIPPNGMADLMNGRVGDHLLVNGQKQPVLAVAPGSGLRLRLINATNARYLRLAFDGLPFTLIGSDGGLLEAPVAGLTEIVLVPAERIELVVTFPASGRVTLRHLGQERGWMGAGAPDDAGPVMAFEVGGAPAGPPPPLPPRLRAIADLGAPALRRRLVFGEDMRMVPGGMEMRFLIDGKAFDMARIDLTGKVGQVELWEIANPTDMDHPFHIHGTQFQVVATVRDRIERPAPFRAWKDTVNVVRGESVLLKLRQDMPGPRMYHCHILEHEGLGMMGTLDVTA